MFTLTLQCGMPENIVCQRRPAKSVERSSDPNLTNQMFLKISKINFDYFVRNNWRKRAKKSINEVFDEDLDLLIFLISIIN